MSKKNLVHAGITNPQGQECSVPELLRINLQVLRLLNAAPAQLRRVGSGWRLAVAPSRLEKGRFLVTIVLDLFVICSTIFDLAERNPKRRVHSNTAALSTFIYFSDQTLILLCHLFSEQHLLDKMMNFTTTLQQLEKMNMSFNGGWFSMRHQKIKVSLLIFFIIWAFLSLTNHVFWGMYMQWSTVTNTNPALYVLGINAYVFMISIINQLWWSATIAEISYTITEINMQIRQLLHRNITDAEDLHSTIRFLGQCYETLCDIIRKIGKDSGMFFLLLFMSKFSKLLITPYNLLNSLGSSVDRPFIAMTQINWCIFHVISIIMVVEPCHWVEDQMERTHDLLIRLARRTGQRHGRIFSELNLFILQVQMRGNSFTPMGIFTIARPLVATIFGGVTTYLAIVLQTQTDND